MFQNSHQLVPVKKMKADHQTQIPSSSFLITARDLNIISKTALLEQFFHRKTRKLHSESSIPQGKAYK